MKMFGVYMNVQSHTEDHIPDTHHHKVCSDFRMPHTMSNYTIVNLYRTTK